MLQHTRTTKTQEFQDLYDSSVAVLLREREREMQREVNTGHPFGSRLHIILSIIIFTNITEQMSLIVAFMAILSLGKPNYEKTLVHYCNGSVRKFA